MSTSTIVQKRNFDDGIFDNNDILDDDEIQPYPSSSTIGQKQQIDDDGIFDDDEIQPSPSYSSSTIGQKRKLDDDDTDITSNTTNLPVLKKSKTFDDVKIKDVEKWLGLGDSLLISTYDLPTALTLIVKLTGTTFFDSLLKHISTLSENFNSNLILINDPDQTDIHIRLQYLHSNSKSLFNVRDYSITTDNFESEFDRIKQHLLTGIETHTDIKQGRYVMITANFGIWSIPYKSILVDNNLSSERSGTDFLDAALHLPFFNHYLLKSIFIFKPIWFVEAFAERVLLRLLKHDYDSLRYPIIISKDNNDLYSDTMIEQIKSKFKKVIDEEKIWDTQPCETHYHMISSPVKTQ